MTETTTQTKQKQTEPSSTQTLHATTKEMTESIFVVWTHAKRHHRDRRARTSPRPYSASKIVKKYHRESGLNCSLKSYVRDNLSTFESAAAGAAPGSIEWAFASWKKRA